MTKQAARRNVLALVMVPAAFLLGLVLAVVVAGSASADSPLPTTSTTGTTTSSTTGGLSTGGFDQNSPQAQFLVINGTVNATSDHEIVGSSAFPNYITGAVDNYYSLAHSYMDNSPFSEGTASPADTGPVGQTAAAGNAQQPQYADARWPGGPATANYGSKGQPFADAGAYQSLAKANASEATNGLSSPGLGGSKTLPVPKGFDTKLQQALAGWKSKYLGCPSVPKTSTSPLPALPGVTVPSVKTPTTTVSTPLGSVTTPSTPSVPSVPTQQTRSLSAASIPCASNSGSGGPDGEQLLESSTLAVLVPGTADKNKDINKVSTKELETNPTTTATTTTDTTQTAPTTTGGDAWKPKPYTLMMSGISGVGRVSLGGGQIVIKGITVDASVENDGTAKPRYKANVTVASASIGGIPVTIDHDGVHVAGKRQDLPYKQASDSLNTALKQAGIQIFLVAPQVTNCDQSSSGTSTSTTTTTTTDTTSAGQSGPCAQTGAIGGACSSTDTGTDTTSTSTSTSTTTTTSSTPAPTPPLPAGSGGTDTTSTAMPACPPPPTSCDTGMTSTGNSTTTGNTTTTGATPPATPPIGGSTTGTTTTTSSTTSTGQTDTTSIGPSECTPPPTSCPGTATGTTPTTTTSTDTTATAGAPNPMGGAGTAGGQQTIVMATGVHIVFTQPVSPSGVPAQFVEHILGEVFINSLATPAPPLPAVAPLGAAGSASSSSCLGGGKHSKSSLSGGGGSSAAGGSSGGGVLGSSSGSSSLSPTGSSYAASSQPGSGSTSGSLPAVFARALHKPLWLLLAYLVWQLLVIGTGWSLWNWRRGEHT